MVGLTLQTPTWEGDRGVGRFLVRLAVDVQVKAMTFSIFIIVFPARETNPPLLHAIIYKNGRLFQTSRFVYLILLYSFELDLFCFVLFNSLSAF